MGDLHEISCLAQVSKSIKSSLPDADQLAIQHIVSLEHMAHQKTNLSTWCKNLSSIFAPWLVYTKYTYEQICVVKRYSWCRVHCYNRDTYSRASKTEILVKSFNFGIKCEIWLKRSPAWVDRLPKWCQKIGPGQRMRSKVML